MNGNPNELTETGGIDAPEVAAAPTSEVSVPESAPVPSEVPSPTDPHHHHDDTTLSEYFESLLVTVILALFATTFILQAFKIPSRSMEGTLLVGDSKQTFDDYVRQLSSTTGMPHSYCRLNAKKIFDNSDVWRQPLHLFG